MAIATKPALERQMIARALDAGVPAAWVAGDEVYGADPGLRAAMEQRRIGYVLAVAKDQHVATPAGAFRADAIAAWLPPRAYRILVNAFNASCRRRRREPAQSLRADFGDVQVPCDRLAQPIRSAEAEALDRLAEADLTQALHELPPGFGAAVYLADVEGYPCHEIALIMGTPLGTVMSRLHRGRQKLRERLATQAGSARQGSARAGCERRPDADLAPGRPAGKCAVR